MKEAGVKVFQALREALMGPDRTKVMHRAGVRFRLHDNEHPVPTDVDRTAAREARRLAAIDGARFDHAKERRSRSHR